MKHLSAANKYFWKYRKRLLIGAFFVIASNYFGVLAPEITGYIVNKVQQHLPGAAQVNNKTTYNSTVNFFVAWVEKLNFTQVVLVCSLTILLLALLRGLFMFMMRQTLIVMSRLIEFDMKNEVYNHYQQLDAGFYKVNRTGDLMNRISEDISRVRMYTGPAVMYFVNLVSLIAFCVVNMLRKDVYLSMMVLAPLPILAITIYFVNTLIHKKSEQVQGALSDLTTNAQESYSGIRVIKSFVQEKAMLYFFKANSETYRKNAIGLAKTEAIYFPSMTLMVGLSTLLTILIGGNMALEHPDKIGIIVEFVIYINMLSFPVTAIGSVASMVQRAAASQKRLNEFLQTTPNIQSPAPTAADTQQLNGDIAFNNVSFTYQHTGIQALKHFNLTIKEGQKILVLGRTGSGKSTMAQLLLRFFDANEGNITINGKDLRNIPLHNLRNNISYVPQDVFLFSDTVAGNISFGLPHIADMNTITHAATMAGIHQELSDLPNGYETMVGERGVTLSGGQKQRLSIARALIKQPRIMVFDDCLSAVDAKTEHLIINNLYKVMENKTAILITHRIFTVLNFDQIVIIDEGTIIEQGTHAELMALKGYYAELYQMQMSQDNAA
ncbi:ABC transporter ATP-binding protein [Limnovirga soli]|uniref:ATP-binding cassette domain-containing protein n=1 Tax=Limnovirga soli TaxID=2656915 RepID=A0A8J8JTH3_9BACT|nr:ABC transporter ATP-binding protein [Limnovirga soli]NNV58022.1 ATP-binding cassette domain-containing protein [Limnovirga soli]